MKRALVAITLVCALPAHANIWQNAIDRGAPDATKDIYESELRQGDEHVAQASSHSSSRSEMKRQVSNAVLSYRNAAAARPREAEPYFRIANLLFSFYLQECRDFAPILYPSPLRDCSDPSKIDVGIAKQVVEAWNAAEARAPLDPRFTAFEGGSILFERALLNTRIATLPSFEAAARDYEAYLDRGDGKGDGMENVWSNLAETYMMLNRLDDSIDAYRVALRVGSDVSTRYGYAVALDRAERGSSARDVILAQTKDSLVTFKHRVDNLKSTFFVPVGEKFYYYALAEEAFGETEAAIDHWRMYISSGAHPQYQPRAKEHLNALLAKQRSRPAPPRDWIWDAR